MSRTWKTDWRSAWTKAQDDALLRLADETAKTYPEAPDLHRAGIIAARLAGVETGGKRSGVSADAVRERLAILRGVRTASGRPSPPAQLSLAETVSPPPPAMPTPSPTQSPTDGSGNVTAALVRIAAALERIAATEEANLGFDPIEVGTGQGRG